MGQPWHAVDAFGGHQRRQSIRPPARRAGHVRSPNRPPPTPWRSCALTLNAIESGALPTLGSSTTAGFRRASEHLVAATPDGALWAGPDDDGRPRATERCTPNNDDQLVAPRRRCRRRCPPPSPQRAGDLDVLIVQATGNDSDQLCISGPPLPPGPCPGGRGFVPIEGRRDRLELPGRPITWPDRGSDGCPATAERRGARS